MSRPGLRVGWVPFKDDARTASVRLRVLLPCRYLDEAGFRTTILRSGADSGEYDCVVFQKAYGKRDLELATRLVERGTKVVFDLCDDHFYNPHDDPRLSERAARLERMIERVDAVTTPTPELAQLVASKPTFLVDDALEVPSVGPLDRMLLSAGQRRRRHDAVRLVWFGNSGSVNPPFGMVHVAGVLPDLERLNRTLPLELTVISNSRKMFDQYFASTSFRVRYVEWRARSFGRHLAGHNVCVLPIEQNPFTIGKSNNRVVTALMLGVPVVASRLPSYEEFSPWVRFGDWAESISALAADRVLAAAQVRAAQSYITSTYTPQRVVDQWGAALHAVVRS